MSLSIFKQRLFVGLGLAALSGLHLSVAIAEEPPKAAVSVEVPFEKYNLDNGLEVILHVDRSAPLIAVNVWYHVGSGDELVGKSGFAHLFEHMMFQGTKHTGQDVHFPILQQIGASAINGTTNPDRTNYFETVPAHQIETALWLESDRMGFLLDALSEESFRNQVDVVRNERRQRYDNVAYGKTRFELAASLYPEGHPYRYLTIGLHDDLVNASLEDVRSFFRTWYVPNNATLTIAGDFDIADMKGLIEKWFGGIPKGGAVPRREVDAPALTATISKELPDTFAKLVQVQRVWMGPKRLSPESFPVEVLAQVLGAEGWGRLSRRLVVETGLCASVSAYFDGRGHHGEIVVAAQLKPNADKLEVISIIDAEIARISSEPISEAELKRVLVNAESSFVWGLEDLARRADQLQFFNHYVGDPGYSTKYLEALRQVNAAQVLEAARRWLGKPHVEVVTVPAVAKDDKDGDKKDGAK
jgi:zinc protease